MIDYFTLKIIHVISATFIFGGGLVTFFYQLFMQTQISDLQARAPLLKICLQYAWGIIIPCATLQVITGFYIITVKHYDVHQLWIIITFCGFIIASINWLLSLYYLMQLYQLTLDQLTPDHLSNSNQSSLRQYQLLFNRQCFFGCIASYAVLLILFFMANH